MVTHTTEKHDLTDIVPHQYKLRNKNRDPSDNFVPSESYVTSNTTRRNNYIRRYSTCFTPNVAYIWHIAKKIKRKVLDS